MDSNPGKRQSFITKLKLSLLSAVYVEREESPKYDLYLYASREVNLVKGSYEIKYSLYFSLGSCGFYEHKMFIKLGDIEVYKGNPYCSDYCTDVYEWYNDTKVIILNDNVSSINIGTYWHKVWFRDTYDGFGIVYARRILDLSPQVTIIDPVPVG